MILIKYNDDVDDTNNGVDRDGVNADIDNVGLMVMGDDEYFDYYYDD